MAVQLSRRESLRIVLDGSFGAAEYLINAINVEVKSAVAVTYLLQRAAAPQRRRTVSKQHLRGGGGADGGCDQGEAIELTAQLA